VSDLTSFKGIYCSGFLVPDPKSLTALCLMFESLRIPNNIEFVQEFSKRYRFRSPGKYVGYGKITVRELDEESGEEREGDPFNDLNPEEKETATDYLFRAARWLMLYSELMPEILETELFQEGVPLEVKLIRRGISGEKNLYQVSTKPLLLRGGDETTFEKLVGNGYVPVVTSIRPPSLVYSSLDRPSATQLAALLAMKSIEIVLPSVNAVQPELILEARDRLSDLLPQFWGAMLRLSKELRSRIDDGMDNIQLLRECQDLVDTDVRPALVELQRKMEMEKGNWFYRILSPVQKGIKLMIGNPLLTQQQLLINALLLGTEATMAAADHMRSIEALQGQSGLTYLLDLVETFE